MKKRLFLFALTAFLVTAVQASVVSVNAPSASSMGDGTSVYDVVWSGDLTTTYTATPYTGLSAHYVVAGAYKQTTLTFVCGNDVYVAPNYPVKAGVYTVTASPVTPGDSLNPDMAVTTLTILPATVSVENSMIVITKFYDGNDIAEVSNIGILDGLLGNDIVSHTVEAHYDNPNVGSDKDITISYALSGNTAANYQLLTPQKVIHNGAIIEDMSPDPAYAGTDGYNNGIEVEAYGYCTGTGAIEYHLVSGQPDQYRLVFDDPAFTDVNWRNLDTPGRNGTININIPAGIVTGDYTATLTLRHHNYPTLLSKPIRIKFHVNLPETYVMPLFNDVIALVDTCQCLTDIQWYHREAGDAQWTLIEGANDYYYRQEGGLTGEYFVSCKMDGVETFTCPQQNMWDLIEEEQSVKAYPNPTTDKVTISLTGSRSNTHALRVINIMGSVLFSTSFEGDNATVDMSRFHQGTYIISIDGSAVRVVRK